MMPYFQLITDQSDGCVTFVPRDPSVHTGPYMEGMSSEVCMAIGRGSFIHFTIVWREGYKCTHGRVLYRMLRYVLGVQGMNDFTASNEFSIPEQAMRQLKKKFGC
ncbi:uncharacterized protein LOC141915525 [Tubulanus polymorphus]|uniref:uncharacterized protein LOC141915525 n=1 Tax=Tubulanus polymorphus TaxID=672921 RepID=UPI003DA4D7F6